MSIDRTPLTTPVTAITPVQDLRSRTAFQETGKPGARMSDEPHSSVTLSSLTQQLKADSHEDIDVARVAEIRAKLEAGELTINPERIAHALVQDIFQSN